MNKLKHLIGLTLICLLISLWSCPSYALTVEDISNPRQTYDSWVIDTAYILSDATESRLNKIISQLENHKGIEFAVVTVPETSPASSTKAFATELFNYWGIGKRLKNNGILFLVSVNERRVEIETGLGIESTIPNSKIRQIIDREVKSKFRKGNFDRAVMGITEKLIAELDLDGQIQIDSTVYQYIKDIEGFLLLGLFFLIGIAAIEIGKIREKDKADSGNINNFTLYDLSSRDTCDSLSLNSTVSDGGGNFGDSCSHGSVSGSDFGGGSSDGGGAGGHW